MTQAKLVPSPAEGHGLTDRITDPLFAAYLKGDRTDLIPALVLLKVHGAGGNDTANGRHQFVRFEATRCEPIPVEDRTDALWQIQALYEARTSTGTQRPLPIGLPNEERRQFLMERIEQWATDNGVSGADLEQQWRAEFGIGDVDGADYGTPADYRHASVQKLLQFALECGAEKQPEDDAPPAVLSDEDGIGEDSLAEPDDDPLAADAEPVAEPPKSRRRGGAKGLAAVPSTEE